MREGGMRLVKEIITGIGQLFYPHRCTGCGTDLLGEEQILCIHCVTNLPATRFEACPDNPIEKIFWGRTPVLAATAHYYFTKKSALQHTLHHFKYRGRKEIGLYFGHIMGNAIRHNDRFNSIEAIIPLPLFISREKTRGYNQAAVLCDGMADVLHLPVLKDAVKRIRSTTTQTAKNRIERWQNMQDTFILSGGQAIPYRHILLVDDIITTGATLDACAGMLAGAGVHISIAALACTVSV
jgi:ComF family protein